MGQNRPQRLGAKWTYIDPAVADPGEGKITFLTLEGNIYDLKVEGKY